VGTHLPEPGTRSVHADVLLLRHNLVPLIDAGKFACMLMQFPNSFRANEATRSYLGLLRESLEDMPLVAEFRHREWQTPDTMAMLRDLNIGFVNVDLPHFKTLLRFHGRNAANWWRGTNETRYDYFYKPAELEPWVNRIIDIAANPDVREVLSFFNNHARGQAVRNAEMFEDMLAAVLPKDD
jgi:uncharacterized protein YecE (DUF72 family)